MTSEPAAGPPIVTLLTDFGLADAFAGVMKGVILGRAPDCGIVDLTHEVPAQGVSQAAFLLETAWRYFPEGSVHIVVVDPGVGTDRRRLALRSGGHFFVGPDNGVLSAALPPEARGRREVGRGYEARTLPVPPDVEAVSIENESIFNRPVSRTFEGRDVFAPAAAYLAAGGELAGLGDSMAEVLSLPEFRAPRAGSGLDGVIVHVDRYGNLITDIVPGDLPPAAVFEAAGRSIALAPNYAAAELAAIAGSSGRIEIALRNGSAAGLLGLGVGDRVRVGR